MRMFFDWGRDDIFKSRLLEVEQRRTPTSVAKTGPNEPTSDTPRTYPYPQLFKQPRFSQIVGPKSFFQFFLSEMMIFPRLRHVPDPGPLHLRTPQIKASTRDVSA